MAATYFLFGDPDWVGVLAYAVIFFLSVAGFVVTVFVICKKVFGGRGAVRLPTINPDAAEGRTNEQR
jgi:hypothetical protein